MATKVTWDRDHRYLWPAVMQALAEAGAKRVLDIGCYSGEMDAALIKAGMEVVGLDNSLKDIERGRGGFPNQTFVLHDIMDPLPKDLCNAFDTVVATEVIEHLFSPARLFLRAREALTPGGALIVTTPFHNYWKNLALAVTGKLEGHWRPMDGGHIKFFSQHSLTDLANNCGFQPRRWDRAGRVRPLAATMVMTATTRS